MDWIKPKNYDFINKPLVLIKCEDGYFMIGRLYKDSMSGFEYWGSSEDYWSYPASDRGPRTYIRPYLPAIEWIGLE